MPILPENRKRYPADWALRRRFILTHRAKNRCEWCGIENGKVYLDRNQTERRVVLTLAHVNDRNPEAASLLNLAALCQRCHLAHDNPRRWRDRRRRLERANGQTLLIPDVEEN